MDTSCCVQGEGQATMVPRWMAGATQRDRVGALLALLADKLDGTSAVVEAVPAIEVEDAPETDGFSPFGRGDAADAEHHMQMTPVS